MQYGCGVVDKPCGLEIYVCPVCKGGLHQEQDTLCCTACSHSYFVRGDIPDFIEEELSRSNDPVLRRMTAIDRMARIYETSMWYPIVLYLYGGFHSTSLAKLVDAISQKVSSTKGKVLDVACGPGTFGRHVASPTREVFGIDVSGRMLRQGTVYASQDGVLNMHFARARVEMLPFEAETFDAVICCGSLHLFADTKVALTEIARVAKSDAILAVFTFTAGRKGILKYRRVREWSRKNHGLHVFEIPEMRQYLADAGFHNFQPEVSGSILTFSAKKTAVASSLRN